ncbi:MAG: hypothetical protein H6702_18400 [Myxococcales bacterium]|nr:hypothetical protein [Myxococcales bacterium]
MGRRCAPPCDIAGACPPGTLCRPTRLGPLCLTPCDPVGGDGCAEGEACAPVGAATEGRCALPEGQALGAACGAGCAPPGRCVADAAGDRCRAPCAGDGDCPAGAACVRLGPTDPLGVCLPAGDASAGAPCERGDECAGGACAAVGGRCGRPCDRDDDCRAGDRCVGPDRDPFTADGRCVPPCEGDMDCPTGLVCRQDGRGRGACWAPAGP